MMESMIEGQPSYWHRNALLRFLHGLRFDYGNVQRFIQRSKEAIQQEPEPLKREQGGHQLNWICQNLDAITQAHLQQYDRDMVQELIHRLADVKHWNRLQIEHMMRQCRLENVPSLDPSTVMPEARLLLSTDA
jgi:hypothetical protein